MAEPDGWVRLHPLSPLLGAGRFLLVALLLGFRLWADLATNLAPGAGALAGAGAALVAAALLAFAYSSVAWRFNGYRITSEMVELRTGILFRSYRHLPFERIEAIDTARPLIPRLLGLAEVRVEAISKQGSELRLRYLAHDDAERLRLELTARRHGTAAAAAGAAAPAAGEAAPSAILLVPTRELVLGHVLIPVSAALAVAVPVLVLVGLAAGWEAAAAGAFTGVLIATGLVLPMLLRLEGLWRFRLDDSGDALVINRGLLNLHTQRIVTGRVQALRVEQPLLWRLYKRYRVRVDVAGYRGASNDAAAAAATLVPIAPYEVVRFLVHRLEIRTDLADLAYEPPPARARWRSLRWRSFGVAWTDTHAVVRSGVLWRRTVVVPHRRVQSARVSQGPWQRRLQLATLRLDTAGSRIRTTAAHRDTGDAVRLAEVSASADRA